MDHENQYNYQRIDLSTDAIRLGVPYGALSYTWGDSPDAYEIFINDRKSLVKENLHMALLALRQTDEDRLLWIDAICIDQDNDKEKGHQVGQMRQIYENAEQVLIWLGPSNRGIDSLMDLARRWDYQTSQRPGAHRAQGWIDSWIKLTADETGPYKEELTANLETLLVKFGTSKATDHRDNIYALLGIASDARASNTLRPNYQVSLGRAICHTISFLLFDEAYDPSARPLPEDMDFTTFLRILPKLSDYILGWALQTSAPRHPSFY
ncbi:heterokaryon incompatibility protein-domain-containing protein [Neurospora tetraspora]|uniref:Heterokaryon incompatibility protein-domain-containing protein n=1 Tax=Neurospora tetraspora TaxID=94610 RepID=A0AAE0JBT9_9PEZI|nr:heterokaryon incompatibility protein-domain-containing protein [Neurospora tetraspora]